MPIVRSPLPQNYTKDEGTPWQGFEDVGEWTKSTNGTIENDTTNYRTGSQSIKMNVTVAGSDVLIYQEFDSVDLQQASSLMSIWVYFHGSSGVEEISSFAVSCYDNGNYYRATFSGAEFLPGWNHIVITRDRWDDNGGDWANIDKVLIRLKGTTGNTPSVSVDSLYHSIDKSDGGRVLITFDDARTSVYTEAFPYMAARGIKGTVFVIPIYIDYDETYMTSSNLDELYAAGWDLANHTYNHWGSPYLVGRSQAQVESELTLCQTWLESRGYTRASRHVAYPGGGYDSTVLAAMASTGMLTGRITAVMRQNVPVENLYLLRPVGMVSVGLSGAKTYINYAVDFGRMTNFYGHTIGDGSISVADFQAIIDYIVERRTVAVTIDEWYQGLTNPRYRGTVLSRSAR